MGYPSSIFVDTARAEALTCAICLDVLEAAVSVCTEGHRYCRACASDVARCPECQEDIQQPHRLRDLNDEISQMRVSCEPLEAPIPRCAWVGLLRDRHSHCTTCSTFSLRQQLQQTREQLRASQAALEDAREQLARQEHHAGAQAGVQVQVQVQPQRADARPPGPLLLGETPVAPPLPPQPPQPRPPPCTTVDAESFASLDTNIFHINPWIQSGKRQNHCFGSFIRASAVNFGAFPLTHVSGPLHASGAPYSELREAIKQDLMNASEDVTKPIAQRRYPAEYYRQTNDPDDFGLETLQMYRVKGNKAGAEATQNALYYGKVRVGDYFIMRHRYDDCPFVPSFLRNLPGGYPNGGVYVIGRVTGRIATGSDQDAEISKLLSRQIEKLWCRDFYPVTFSKLGLLADLDAATQKYLSKICVATMMQVFKPTGTTDANAARRHRDQLWKNATTTISPSDFPENYEIHRFGARATAEE